MARYVIQRSLLDENITRVLDQAHVPVIGVVKADGYGFGMTFMAKALRDRGIRFFAITEIADIATLRDAVGIDDILVMRSSALADEVLPVLEADCIATIGSLNALDALVEAARTLGKTARAHIKIDTGFSRYGFAPQDTEGILACFQREGVSIEGMYTHFSKAYGDEQTTRAQLENLKEAAQAVRDAGFEPGMLHAANSPALFNFSEKMDVQLDAVRIGSAFTGRVSTLKETGLKRVGYLAAQVMDLKDLPRGAKVGYGGLIEVKRPTTLAFISAGVRDGFGVVAKSDPTFKDALSIMKHLRHDTALKVTIAGQSCPLIGEADLSTCYVDATDATVSLGDEARLDPNPLMVPASVIREYI